MAINKELAEKFQLSAATINQIESLHALREAIIDAYTLDDDRKETLNQLSDIEFQLQSLWGFQPDPRYHRHITMLNNHILKLKYAGKTIKCNVTGEEVVIGVEECYAHNLIGVGKGFIDLGDGYYARLCGVTLIGETE